MTAIRDGVGIEGRSARMGNEEDASVVRFGAIQRLATGPIVAGVAFLTQPDSVLAH
jgi:hypothetical protein